MNSYISYHKLDIDSCCRETLEYLCWHFMAHQFNLLGSGFVKVDYQLWPNGMRGRRYRDPYMQNYGQKVAKKLHGKCSRKYVPINWLVDYKSGFFFSPRRYNSWKKCQTVIGRIPGVDIKCPWELGRFYHLVQLAVLASVEQKYQDVFIMEFKDELIDFWEVNPIGRTVQWSIAMEVSIRMVNLLIAYDLFRQIDSNGYLDVAFQAKFEKHIYDSLKYVMNHLEKYNQTGSNHYLADLSGIIFAASYLESDDWTDACLVYGVQELIEQTNKQFYMEGSNFEGSTSYHRLSAEFVLYSTALIFGVLKTKKSKAFTRYDASLISGLKVVKEQKYNLCREFFFPKWYIDRIYNMGIFTDDITKDNNEIIQVGDNDNGRLIKLSPVRVFGEGQELENTLDHRTLLSLMDGLFRNDKFARYGSIFPLESSFVRAVSDSVILSGKIYDTTLVNYGKYEEIPARYQYSKRTILYNNPTGKSLLEGMRIRYFSKFGLVLFRSKTMFLSMVIDTAKYAVYTGHTHNDKLSIELMVEGEDITRDSGTYVYTALPVLRDKFRSVNAHNTIHVEGQEQNLFSGTFGMEKRSEVQLLYCCRDCLMAKARYGNVEHIRKVLFDDCRITVIDYGTCPFTVSFGNKIYSTGYGDIKKKT